MLQRPQLTKGMRSDKIVPGGDGTEFGHPSLVEHEPNLSTMRDVLGHFQMDRLKKICPLW